jgi:hypothetical protein
LAESSVLPVIMVIIIIIIVVMAEVSGPLVKHLHSGADSVVGQEVTSILLQSSVPALHILPRFLSSIALRC